MRLPATTTNLRTAATRQRRRHLARAGVVLAGAAMVLPACGARSGPIVDAIVTTTVAPDTIAPKQLAAAPTTAATTVPPATTTTLPPTTTTTTTVAVTTTSTTTSTTTTSLVPAYQFGQPSQAVPTFPSDSRAAEAAPLIGTLRIPKIDVDVEMYDGINVPTLDLGGAGHWPGTGWPGQSGNVVLGAHRTSHGAPFRRLDELQPGDQIQIEDAAGIHTYAVNHTQVVEPTDVWIIDQTPGATITLFACHPPGSTRQRIVVFGDLVA